MNKLLEFQQKSGADFSGSTDPADVHSFGAWEEEFRAAKQSCALFDLTAFDVVKISGKDAPSLLHRITMNEIRRMKPGDIVINAFPDPKGKVVDAFFQVQADDHIELITVGGKGDVLLEWIDRYVFIEDVQCEKMDGEYRFFLLCGASLPEQFQKGGKTFHFSPAVVSDSAVGFSRVEGLLPSGVLLKTPKSASFPVYQHLVEKEGCKPAGAKAFHALRIEQGVPAHGREITNAVNPYEAGLSKYISYTKGCYTGQEVIARLDTYEKIKFIYSRVSLQNVGEMSLPSPVFANDKNVGEITSVTHIPNEAGKCLGIARIRRKILESGAALTVSLDDKHIPLSILTKR